MRGLLILLGSFILIGSNCSSVPSKTLQNIPYIEINSNPSSQKCRKIKEALTQSELRNVFMFCMEDRLTGCKKILDQMECSYIAGNFCQKYIRDYENGLLRMTINCIMKKN